MYRKTLTVAVIAAIAATGWAKPAEARRRDRIAVAPITASNWRARRTARKATRRLIRMLRRSRRFIVRVLPRSRRIMRCLQQTVCAERVARRYHVKFIVAGHAERIGRKYHVDLRVVSKYGDVLKSASFRGWRGSILWRGSSLAYRLAYRARRMKVARHAKRKSTTVVTKSDAAAVANLAGMPAQDREDPDAKPKKLKALGKGTRVASNALTAPQPAEPGFVERLWSRRYLHAWVTLGAGIGALAAGGVFGTMANKANTEFRAADYQPQAWAAQDRAKRNALTANILFAAGGAAVATSVVMFFIEYRKESRELRSKRNISIGVNVAQQGAGVTLQGRF